MDNLNKDHAGFVPPRHWIGPEELEAGYWSNPSVIEKRSQEFFEKPIELIDKIDRSAQAGFARRDFLTIMGASMAMASFACARRPVHKIIPYVVKPEEVIPGVPTWYATTCKETGYGILVKNREGRPIKIEGNPDHPMTRGASTARAQASVLGLYDPDRLRGPIARKPGSGESAKDMGWEDADKIIVQKLKSSSRVRVLSGEMKSESTQRLVKEFLAGFANGAHVVYQPVSQEAVSEAQAASYGTAVVPRYRFDEASMIVSLGADFLGTWPNAIEYAAQWAKNRKLDSKNAAHGKLSKMVCFESTMTITGANSDERHAVRPGDELKVAMALANELIIGKGTALSGDAAVNSALQGYTIEAVAAEIGLDAGKLKAVAHELAQNRGKSLVVAGGVHSHTGGATALQVAVNLLNSALGNDGATVDGTALPLSSKSSSGDLSKLIQEMNQGAVDVLVIYRSNLAYALPNRVSGFDDALKKVGMVISVSDRVDETGLLANFVLPDHHPLENWGDASPRKGLFSVQQPAMAPMHSTRAFEDSLITWAKATGKATGLIGASADWHAYLMANWKQTVFAQHKGVTGFEQFWEGVLRAGVYDVYGQGSASMKGSARSFRSGSLSMVPKYAKAAGGMTFAMYETVMMGDGTCANNAWLQELPDPISSVTWDNFLNVAPKTAQQLGLKENDVVEVRSGEVVVSLPVHVQPGMHPSVVSAAIGYGRRKVGKVGNGTGVDVYPLARLEKGAVAFSGQEVSLRKTGVVYALAATQWHTASENRPIINDITLAEFRKNPGLSNHTDPHLRMDTVPTIWSTHEYKGHRWGMSIDLNSCIGCGACVIGCQAENNIPVVGREQVRNSRQMHWIRIDRYYSGSAENPDVIFQPMLCQHCENAPCETVCPVLATVHDDEGLNVQVYNRCVGTRYCQNNCPYKVRRFNFFDHWKAYEGPMNLAWNPDVTVRTRGIMEKCTFCTQRIRDAKEKAKDLGATVKDGDFKTACQQACPTEAIVFGDVNNAKSQVTKLSADARSFRSLEVLNARPMISYLTKVRNKEASAEHGGHH